MHQGQWWDSVTPAQIAHTYQVARAWCAEDPEARRAEQRVREELRNRYGVAVEKTNPDPAALRTAVEQAEQDRANAVDEPSLGALKVVKAQQLLQKAERLDATDETSSSGAGSREGGRALYDSAERRQAAADDLEAKAIEREVAATSMRADVSQAKPATHALKADDADTGTKARKTHGRVAQAHRSGLDR